MTKFSRAKLRGRIVEIFGTQTAFAESIGSAKNSVSFILTGKCDPNCETIYTWSKALQISTGEIGEYFFTPDSPTS